MKKREYYLQAWCPRRKQFFTWHGWTIKKLKPLADAEGLKKLKKIYIKHG